MKLRVGLWYVILKVIIITWLVHVLGKTTKISSFIDLCKRKLSCHYKQKETMFFHMHFCANEEA